MHKGYRSCNYKFSTKKVKEYGKKIKNAQASIKEKPQLNPLPNFLNWLKQQIGSEDKQFSLDPQELLFAIHQAQV